MRLPSNVIRSGYFNYSINGNPVSDEVLKRTTMIQFTESDEKSDSARITIKDPTYEIFDSPEIVEGAKITLWGGFKDFYREMMRGYIAALDPNFPPNDAPTITLVCMDETYPMSIDPKSRSWKNVKISTVVEQIAKEYGLYAEVQDTVEVLQTITQSNETDIALIMKMAQDVGFQCYVRQGTLYFKERNLTGSPKGYFWYNSGDSSLISFRPQFVAIKDIGNQSGTIVTQDVTESKGNAKTIITHKTESQANAPAPQNKPQDRPPRA